MESLPSGGWAKLVGLISVCYAIVTYDSAPPAKDGHGTGDKQGRGGLEQRGE